MKFLAMHIAKQALRFNIFTDGNVQNIFMEHGLYLISKWFWHKWKIYNFDPYNVLPQIYRATYDWFCSPGSHIIKMQLFQYTDDLKVVKSQ